MKLLTVQEAMREDVFKFVHLESGEMRLFLNATMHSTMVRPGEKAIGAGIASYLPRINSNGEMHTHVPFVRIDGPYSSSLNVKTTEADCKVLAELFGCRVEYA
jgi:hypothetical protein